MHNNVKEFLSFWMFALLFGHREGNNPIATNNTMSEYKTSDIRISKDSAGYYNASHKHQGSLYEMCYFNDRNEARRAAVEDLMRIKEFGKSDAYDIHNDY